MLSRLQFPTSSFTYPHYNLSHHSVNLGSQLPGMEYARIPMPAPSLSTSVLQGVFPGRRENSGIQNGLKPSRNLGVLESERTKAELKLLWDEVERDVKSEIAKGVVSK